MAQKNLSDSLLLLGGQLLSAVGLLVGVRLLAEAVGTATFGASQLAMGLATVSTQLTALPLGQAVLRYFSEYNRHGAVADLRHVAYRRVARLCGPAVILAAAVSPLVDRGGHYGLPLAVAALVAVEAIRVIELSFLSASRRHLYYATWTALEAWLRPLLATLLVATVENSPTYVVLGFALGGAVPITIRLLSMRQATPSVGLGSASRAAHARLSEGFKDFYLPLIPQAIPTLAVAIGDRYVINAFWNASEVGVYAAAYAIASKPFLLSHMALEQAYRPRYFEALASEDLPKATEVFRTYVRAVALLTISMVVSMLLFRHVLVSLLLPAEFSASARLLPGLVIGHGFAIVALTCYTGLCAACRTTDILVSRSVAAMTAAACLIAAVPTWGALGAAAACPAYYGVEAACALWFYRRSRNAAADRLAHRELAEVGA